MFDTWDWVTTLARWHGTEPARFQSMNFDLPQWSRFAQFDQLFKSESDSVNWVSNETAVTLTMALPGVKREDIDVTIAKRSLRIRCLDRFKRQVDDEHDLPSDCVTKLVKSTFVDGILTITIPRSKELQDELIKVSIT